MASVKRLNQEVPSRAIVRRIPPTHVNVQRIHGQKSVSPKLRKAIVMLGRKVVTIHDFERLVPCEVRELRTGDIVCWKRFFVDSPSERTRSMELHLGVFTPERGLLVTHTNLVDFNSRPKELDTQRMVFLRLGGEQKAMSGDPTYYKPETLTQLLKKKDELIRLTPKTTAYRDHKE